jgi:hypothetical protein
VRNKGATDFINLPAFNPGTPTNPIGASIRGTTISKPTGLFALWSS